MWKNVFVQRWKNFGWSADAWDWLPDEFVPKVDLLLITSIGARCLAHRRGSANYSIKREFVLLLVVRRLYRGLQRSNNR